MTYQKGGPRLRCLVVTDGRAGIVNQALGLAEAIGRQRPVDIRAYAFDPPSPWARLPRGVWPKRIVDNAAAACLAENGPPDILIGCGRRSTPLVAALKVRHPEIFAVQLQHPRADPSRFDLVIPPVHDRMVIAPNVEPMIGAPQRLTPAAVRLAAASRDGAFPKDAVVVLLGGPNRAFTMGTDAIVEAVSKLSDEGRPVIVVASRRTPLAVVKALEAPGVSGTGIRLFRDGAGRADNPYPGVLAGASAILVTEDSVNMACEAAALGAPVYIIRLPRKWGGLTAGKFDRFHASLFANGHARPFEGLLEAWRQTPLSETDRIAAIVCERFETRNEAGEQRAFDETLQG